MKNPAVYIIVLNWNHLEDLIMTIESFLKQDYLNLKLIVCDNASTDGSQDYVKLNYPQITLLENKKNLGWTAGNNVGVKYALKNGADYILIANNDLYFDNSLIITTLVNDLNELKDHNIKIIGTSVNYYYERKKTHNTGWNMYPKGDSKGNYFNKYRQNITQKIDSCYEFVDSADGCFFLVASNVFKHVGLFKEELFAYGDEIEFSLRAWSQGYKSIINKKLTIYHKIGTTNIPNSPLSTYYRTRNLYYLIKTNGNRFRYKYLYFKNLFKAIFINIFITKNDFKKKIEVEISRYYGVKDGINNKFRRRY